MRVFFRRRLSSFRAVALSVTIISLALWATGLLDHAFELSFSEFRWPPYVNVSEQVKLAFNNQRAEYMFQNDWVDFEPVIAPKCVDKTVKIPEKYLLIVVKSAAVNFPNREAIRATWGAVISHSNFTVRTIFLTGRMALTDEKRLGDVLASEAREYGDLLVGNFIDDYRNNTLKFMLAIQLSYSYCLHDSTVPFAFFVDDDYFVSVSNLVKELEHRRPTEKLYMGWRFDTTPFRFSFHKHRVPLNEYPYDRYPPYISAGAVLLSRQTIREMYFAIRYVKIFKYDDVYAGILAHLLDTPVIHNERMLFWHRVLKEKDTSWVVCAHGYGPGQLREVYSAFSKKGLL